MNAIVTMKLDREGPAARPAAAARGARVPRRRSRRHRSTRDEADSLPRARLPHSAPRDQQLNAALALAAARATTSGASTRAWRLRVRAERCGCEA